MPEVGKIDDLHHCKAVEFERPAEYVGENEHRKVPDMLYPVDRGSAVVHSHRLCVRRQAEHLFRL